LLEPVDGSNKQGWQNPEKSIEHPTTIKYPHMEQVKRFLQGTHAFQQLEVAMPHREIMTEMLAIRSLARDIEAPHSRGWSRLVLYGHGLHEHRSFRDYTAPWQGYDRHYRWSDEIREQIPHTRRFFRTFTPFPHLRRIRLQWLEPGGHILPHTDPLGGVDRRVSVNIAVNNPPGCEMHFGDHRVPFQPGTAFMIDPTQEHQVHNQSSQARAHLLLDGAT
jgi:hypothetical protein